MRIKAKYHDNDELKELVTSALKRRLCRVFFYKTDGSKRILLGTLIETFLPPTQKLLAEQLPKLEKPDLVTVFDVEVMEWRSFKIENFVKLVTVD